MNLLWGLLKRMESDISECEAAAASPSGTRPPDNLAEGIYRPDLDVVWLSLGHLGTEGSRAYVDLDASILAYQRITGRAAESHQQELARLQVMVRGLLYEIEQSTARVNKVLVETQPRMA